MRLLMVTAALLWQASAAAASLTATVDRQQTDLQNPLLLTLTVEGSQSAEPTLPDLSMFDVQPRGRSSNIQMINGRFNSSATYGFVLVPKRAGKFTIGAAEVVIDHTTYHSAPLEVSVGAAPTSSAQADAPLFITGEVSQKSPYVGQQLIYTWRFYRRERVGAASVALPEFPEFVVEPLGERREFETLRGGQRYTVTEIRKALFAQESGSITVAGATLQCEVFTGARLDDFGSPFDALFNHGARQSKSLRSAPIVLQVQKLPPAPRDDAELVGKLEVRARLSHTDLKVGDSTTLTLEVAGTGNIKQALEPSLPPLAAFKVYDDKPQLSARLHDGMLLTTKTFKKALVPIAAGELSIGPPSLTYFDPAAQAYKVAAAPALRLHVRGGPAAGGAAAVAPPAAGAAVPRQQDVRVLGEDILPIYRRPDALGTHRFRTFDRALWALLFVFPLGFCGAATLLGRRRSDGAHWAQKRRRDGALKAALAEHKALGPLLDAGDLTAAARLASQLARRYLGRKLDTEGLALTATEARQRLCDAGVADPLAQRSEDLLQRCEAAQYGALADPGRRLADVEDEVRSLLTELDRCLP